MIEVSFWLSMVQVFLFASPRMRWHLAKEVAQTSDLEDLQSAKHVIYMAVGQNLSLDLPSRSLEKIKNNPQKVP